MKKISTLWCIFVLFSLTMNAQFIKTDGMSEMSTQASLQDYQNRTANADTGYQSSNLSDTRYASDNVNYAASSFVTTWTTTMPNEMITIPTTGSGYNYSVDWGDGSSSSFMADASHTYLLPGTYTVEISGDFPRIYFNNGPERLKISSIEQWGTYPWTSMNAAFAGCENLVSNAMDMPNLSMVMDMNAMFAFARKFKGDAQMGNWNVSNVTNMARMFAGNSVFNHDINNWDVSNVTDMSEMFYGATEFNQDLGAWDVSSVMTMESMFRTAMNFNGNISGWNVINVTNMEAMFGHANRFNQNLGNWDVSNVTNMHGMFGYARDFNQNLNNWNVSNVTDMIGMFAGASVFNGNISSWDVSNVTNMRNMFYGATKFSGDLSSWNVGNVTSMSGTFRTAMNFNSNISNWNVSEVKNMDYMFYHANKFDQNLGNWNVSKVVTMKSMFINVKLSVDNYDALLIGWNSRPLKNNVKFNAGKSKYCAGAAARQSIIDNHNWTIMDQGLFCAPITGDRPNVGGNESVSGLSFYPNPVRSQLNIANISGQRLESASIYDLAGRLIKTVDLSTMGYEGSVDFSDLSRATYMLVINGENGQTSSLIVKE